MPVLLIVSFFQLWPGGKKGMSGGRREGDGHDRVGEVMAMWMADTPRIWQTRLAGGWPGKAYTGESG